MASTVVKKQRSFDTDASSQYDDTWHRDNDSDDTDTTEYGNSEHVSHHFGSNNAREHLEEQSSHHQNDIDTPPAYSTVVGRQESIVEGDGRVQVDLDSKLVRALQAIAPCRDENQTTQPPPDYAQLDLAELAASHLPLNIVIQIVGSRGDVQPFIALGNELQRSGHRVRIATHGVFRDFVVESNLEFYPIGGNPNELMAYMVKNPGLIPSMKTLRGGEISRKRQMIQEMLEGCWESCIERDKVTGLPFVADAIIANPPSFAHVHCAQALGIPLHLMFTMPWTATKSFPHPLANIKNPKTEPGLANQLSYSVVEWMTWQGLGDVINKWRETLDLEHVPMTEGPFLAYTLAIPTTYCWSGALVPKPPDWQQHIDVCGFFFRDTPDYDPPQSLLDFLGNGPPPIYIGFGSIVVEDPEKLTSILLEAVRITGVRAILSKGWSNIGNASSSQNVFLLGDCPHEWLFQRVAAVIHHGGAGTTACGLKHGRPTSIIPFFGDQPFWGDMMAAVGAGPKPIHYKDLSVDNLAEAISFLLMPEVAQAAQEVSARMSADNGVTNAVRSFHRNLPVAAMPCDILPRLPAVWTYKTPKRTIKLSKLAAEILSAHLKIDSKKLGLHETRKYTIENRRWDPITSSTSAIFSTLYNTGIAFKGNKKGRSTYFENNSSSADLDFGEGPSRVTTGSSGTSNSSSSRSGSRTAKSFGNLMKGSVIDIPYAFAEGLRRGPEMYGDKIREQVTITDWKTGGIVAGKHENFAYGLYDGLSGLVMDPIRGHREQGAAGLGKGVGIGLMGVYYKPLGALFGLAAYPLQGIYKSVYSAIHTRTRKRIAEARRAEGIWLWEEANRKAVTDVEIMLTEFDQLCKQKEGK